MSFILTNSLTKKANPSVQTSQGAVLPTVLGILALILVISGQLTDAVLTQHKTNTAYKAQMAAESLAAFAMDTTEQELITSQNRPAVSTTLVALNGQNQLIQGLIWQKQLDNYALLINTNQLTNAALDWTQQPQRWWDTYANNYTQNLSANTTQTAYSIIEEDEIDLSGADLGQALHHYAGPSKVLYQVTSRGSSGNLGVSRLRTTVAKTYR